MENLHVNIELDWKEHKNGLWSLQDCDSIANRDLVQSIYDILLQNEEVRLVPYTTSSNNTDSQLLQQFQFESGSAADLKHYARKIIHLQFELVKETFSASNFPQVLKQRLLILKRIYHAILTQYHDKDKCYHSSIGQEGAGGSAVATATEFLSGSVALLEIGVKTGLTLLFSLIKQNWQVSEMLGVPSLCNSILETTLTLIQKLPPLSLSNESQLTSLGISCIEQVSDFLQESIMYASNTDKRGKLLATELLLNIALQRGSLHCLLDWIRMALDLSSNGADAEIFLSSKSFTDAIVQLNLDKYVADSTELWKTNQQDISVYEIAINVMEILSQMADINGDYTPNEVIEVDECDVYVWGSNSSFQLAENEQVKFLMPVKSKVFTRVQEVRRSVWFTSC